ncbi:CRE-SRJ-18 protein [Caenorhabditis remanei]|uniref:CRE-SRJ-18 protein n=1 Tax=Caenorhabditis remanei TaxID=31234 RepID=E3LLH0_CAERE|nr:CRE-SRJ-18 protein [Caenorhabditis remanei]
MFVNWAHFLIPKVFIVLSLIVNPLFVNLIHTEKVFKFGDYRYLLYFFAGFNVTSALSDLLVPICVHTYRYAPVVFITEGLFENRSHFGSFLIACRCAFISGTYGILNAHFIFRFLVLRYNQFVVQYFKNSGFGAACGLVVFHWFSWAIMTDITMGADGEVRDYIRESFEETYGSMENVNTKVVIFSEASPDVVFRSWVGTIYVTFLATYSIILYLVLGYKIMSSLNRGLTTMSHKTTQMQKQLFLALFVQTAIPICVSFVPCTISLYGSAFRLDFLSWINWSASVAVSSFPFLDPMAITLCLPALRNKLLLRIGFRLSPNTIQTISCL